MCCALLCGLSFFFSPAVHSDLSRLDNKVDQECVDSVFSYAICHEKSETTCGDTSSLLAETLAKSHAVLFGKKADEVSAEKDAEFSAQFVSGLRQSCDQLAGALLGPPPAPVGGEKRRTARSSRKASGGWDDVFAVIKPLSSKGETNKPKLSPFAKELGKLLFEGKVWAKDQEGGVERRRRDKKKRKGRARQLFVDLT